jgi:Flp pilus assembly protein TadD
MKSSLIPHRLTLVSIVLLSFSLGACSSVLSQPSSEGSSAANAQHKLAAGPDTKNVGRTRSAKSAKTEANVPEVDLTPQLLFQLLMSEIAAQRGQMGSASTTYLSMARETRDPRLARRATELALSNRAIDQALPASELWYELAPSSTASSGTLEALLLSTGKLERAEPLMAQRRANAASAGTLPEYYRRLRRTLTRATDKPAALRMLERVSAKDQDVTEARLALASAASAANDSDRAIVEAKAAVNLAPDDQVTVLSAASSASSGGSRQPGIDILSQYLDRKPENLDVRFAYARMLAQDGRRDDAKAQFEQALKQDPESPEILFSLAQLAYQTEQKEVAQDYLERYVALPANVQRDNNPGYLFLGQVAEERREFARAEAAYAKVGKGEQYLDARIRRAIVLGRMDKVEDGRALLRSTSVGAPQDRTRLTSAEAQILRNAKRPKEAFAVLDAAVTKQPNNADLLYDHAMAAEQAGRADVMETSLKKVIEMRPDSAHAYNALGYTLADRNERLEEAEALIRKALKISPEDAHILDSMGWVLFRRGDLDGAEKFLRQALEKSDEVEIAAHLGEVLYAQGKKEEARKYWTQANAQDPENDTLRKTLSRLNIDL